MKKLITCFSFLFVLVISGISLAQTPPGNPGWVQVSVGATPVQVLAFDQSRLDWTIHPEGGNVRCSDGLTNGQNPGTMPTTTTGYEYLANVYLTNYDTPTVSFYCTAETGTVIVDMHITYKGF